jgi:hypothetical protein
LWENARFAVTVSGGGIDCQRAHESREFLAWTEIDSVSYCEQNHFCPHFVIPG